MSLGGTDSPSLGDCSHCFDTCSDSKNRRVTTKTVTYVAPQLNFTSEEALPFLSDEAARLLQDQ